MRIVVIMHLFKPELGYSEYYLARKLKGMGHEVCFVTTDVFTNASNTRCKRSGFFEEEDIKVLRLFTFFEIFDIPFVSLYKLKTFLTKFSPDVIQVQGIMSPLSILTILCKRIFGYKVVVTIISGKVISHGFILALKLALLRIYLKLIFSWVSKNIDGALVCSEAALAWNQKIFHITPTKIHFIPLGADNSLFCPNHCKRLVMRENLGIAKDTAVAIYTGKISPHKRIDKLLTACAPLFKAYNFKLLLVGAGPKEYLFYLGKLIDELQIGDSVMFHQWVHRIELPDYYNVADFAVWPSHHSISMIEAMSTGLPIIIARSNWTNHLLKYKNGFSYPEGDVAKLRSCIRTLLDDVELRLEMGERSCELVQKELNWSTIAREYLKVYNSVLEESSSL